MALRSQHVLSICTGGGGLDLGFGLAVPGARTVCVVEREAFAVAHLVSAMRAGFLDACPVWSDVRTLKGRPWRGVVDWVIGGIPCQPHSAAGRKRGSQDERDLWSTTRRLIVQSGAHGVLIENVEGMLSAGADEIPGAQRVVRDLERLGYVVEIGLFSASEVGFPHRRNRVFILAHRSGGLGLCECSAAGGAECEGPAGAGSVELADAGGARPQRVGADAAAFGRQDARGLSGLCGGAALADADGRQSTRRPGGPGGPGEACRAGAHCQPAGSGRVLAHAEGVLGRGELGRQSLGVDLPISPPGPRDAAAWGAIEEHCPGLLPAHARHDRFRLEIGKACAAENGDPGTGSALDANGPYGLRPAVVQAIAESTLRGVADGMAHRVDRLRMCGNGVHPLEAAYAIRTLGARLAARGGCPAELFIGGGV